jgi:hypothetical protein
MTDQPGSILATGQRLVQEAVAQIPPGKRRALVVLMDGDRTIAAEYVSKFGDAWEFSLSLQKKWEQAPTARIVVRGSW